MKVSNHLAYMSDEMYTPIHYKGDIVKQPVFEGKGNHTVKQLEEICEQFKEYIHQQQLIKQNCKEYVLELKFGVKQRELLLDFAEYSENDKTSNSIDECVDNYLDSLK